MPWSISGFEAFVGAGVPNPFVTFRPAESRALEAEGERLAELHR